MNENITLTNEIIVEQNLPSIIKNEIIALSECKEKADVAKDKAEEAKKIFDELQPVKFGKTKAAVEDLQDAVKILCDAQVSATEAQQKSFEYQEKLARTTKEFFALGVTNMAMNRSVVRELTSTLEGANTEEFDDVTHQEIMNVIKQLKAQEDIMQKQESSSARIDSLEEKIEGKQKIQIMVCFAISVLSFVLAVLGLIF